MSSCLGTDLVLIEMLQVTDKSLANLIATSNYCFCKTSWCSQNLQFPSAVVLNVVGCRKTQMSVKRAEKQERKRKSAKERKREREAQKRVRRTQEGCGGLGGGNPAVFPKWRPIFQQPLSLPESTQTWGFPAASKFARKLFQQGISDSHSLLEFSERAQECFCIKIEKNQV